MNGEAHHAWTKVSKGLVNGYDFIKNYMKWGSFDLALHGEPAALPNSFDFGLPNLSNILQEMSNILQDIKQILLLIVIVVGFCMLVHFCSACYKIIEIVWPVCKSFFKLFSEFISSCLLFFKSSVEKIKSFLLGLCRCCLDFKDLLSRCFVGSFSKILVDIVYWIVVQFLLDCFIYWIFFQFLRQQLEKIKDKDTWKQMCCVWILVYIVGCFLRIFKLDRFDNHFYRTMTLSCFLYLGIEKPLQCIGIVLLFLDYYENKGKIKDDSDLLHFTIGFWFTGNSFMKSTLKSSHVVVRWFLQRNFSNQNSYFGFLFLRCIFVFLELLSDHFIFQRNIDWMLCLEKAHSFMLWFFVDLQVVTSKPTKIPYGEIFIFVYVFLYHVNRHFVLVDFELLVSSKSLVTHTFEHINQQPWTTLMHDSMKFLYVQLSQHKKYFFDVIIPDQLDQVCRIINHPNLKVAFW